MSGKAQTKLNFEKTNSCPTQESSDQGALLLPETIDLSTPEKLEEVDEEQTVEE